MAPQIPILCKSTRGPPISSVFSLALCVSVSTHPSFPQWIASTACSSSSCKAIGGNNLFNPSDAVQTGSSFNITYLQGTVAGPIIWDQVGVGGYIIDNQALGVSFLFQFYIVVLTRLQLRPPSSTANPSHPASKASSASLSPSTPLLPPSSPPSQATPRMVPPGPPTFSPSLPSPPPPLPTFFPSPSNDQAQTAFPPSLA